MWVSKQHCSLYITRKIILRGTLKMDITGFAQLMTTILEGIANLDLKMINLDYLGRLLDTVAPIWNPIWAKVSEFLMEIFYGTL